MSHQRNITRIKAVHNALGNLQKDVVFVGGAAVSLYADRAAPETRETDDVDVLLEIWTYNDYAALEEQLRSLGFVNDSTAKFAGRYLLPGVIIDIMPTAENILGFSNKWYAEGFNKSVNYIIDEQHTVKILSAPYFIASKIEAFKNRGNKDGRTSSDFEDIVFVFENRLSFWKEIAATENELRKYFVAEFNLLLNNTYVEEWVSAHVDFSSSPSTSYILQQMKEFVANQVS